MNPGESWFLKSDDRAVRDRPAVQVFRYKQTLNFFLDRIHNLSDSSLTPSVDSN